jgi:CheY-like chemotaxis protein
MPVRIEFGCITAPAPCMVAGDPAQLQQILIHLCINARDAIQGQGRLEIRTRQAAADELPSRIRCEAESLSYVEISVSDTGRGMDPQTLSYAFDPFFTTKTKDQGTGLGLTMVYRIVEAHDGLVDVISEPDRGTEVRVYLPEAAASALPHVPVAPRPPVQGTGRVLVVDDEEMIASLIKTLLESNGFVVSVAHRPEQALALAAKAEQPMDMVVIDHGLPGMSGDECLRKLRDRWPGLKALLITGSPLDPAELGLHDVSVLHKPFSAQSVTHAVRAVLDESTEK